MQSLVKTELSLPKTATCFKSRRTHIFRGEIQRFDFHAQLSMEEIARAHTLKPRDTFILLHASCARAVCAQSCVEYSTLFSLSGARARISLNPLCPARFIETLYPILLFALPEFFF